MKQQNYIAPIGILLAVILIIVGCLGHFGFVERDGKVTESSYVISQETRFEVTESVSSALPAETEWLSETDADTTPIETELPDETIPETTEPETTKPETTRPETTKPQTARPETTRPETTKPKTTKPETTKPETMSPETEAPLPQEVIKIYIDQGHNPHSHNTGANGNGLREQDINYVVGRELAALLSADPRFAVKLSRPTEDTLLGTDNTSSLKARTDEANRWGADYFISLHCNAFTEASAHGTDVFVYSADSEAYALGERILEKLVEGTGFRNRGMKIKPELYVLRHTTMPAVLVEMGFITNPSDAALLASRPDLFAACIRDGILAYLNT